MRAFACVALLVGILGIAPGASAACPKGTTQRGATCVRILVPENAQLNILGNGWECIRGYRRQGGSCVTVNVPENASLDILGHDWVCDRGFRREGGECVRVVVPEHASLDVLGHGWECVRGYRRQGPGCVPVVVPDHASLDVLGHGWECNQGFRQQAQSCVAMTKSERGEREKRRQQLLDQIQRRTNAKAYKTEIDDDDGDIIILENNAVVEVRRYLGYLGYNKDAILFTTGAGWRLWIEGKGTYKCDLLREPVGRSEGAEHAYLSDVKGDGEILFLGDGSIFEVSYQSYATSLWLGGEEVLILGDSEMLNLDQGDELVDVSRIR